MLHVREGSHLAIRKTCGLMNGGSRVTACPFSLSSRNHCQQFRNRCGIAERLAHMRIEVAIAGSKDETASQLKRIFPQLVLAMAARTGAFASYSVIAPKKVEQRSAA